MNNLEMMLKILILLINEYESTNEIKSKTLAKELLSLTLEKGKVRTFNDGSDVLIKLKNTILTIVDGTITPNEHLFISIEIILADNPVLSKLLHKYTLKKSEHLIKTLSVELNNYLNKLKVKDILMSNLDIVLRNDVDPMDVVIKVAEKMKELSDNTTTTNDGGKIVSSSASLGSVNFDDMESVKNAAKKAVDLITGAKVYKTSWSNLNRTLQGGYRGGETVSVAALPHNYKSGFVKTMALQIIIENKPILKPRFEDSDEMLKPLLLFVTLEEEYDNIMFFFYMYLKFTYDNIVIKEKEQKTLDSDEISKYVYGKINETGWSLIIERMRPDLYNKDEFKKTVDAYKAAGYSLEVLILDYAKKMSRKGLERGGPSGTDLLELYSILRNITSAEDILFITPAQLNTSSKKLLQNGLTPQEFVKYVADKGMYADSSQLDQELDLEIFLKKIVEKDRTYLGVQRGKHRLPTNIAEEDKYLELMFSNGYSPIPGEVGDHQPCVDLSIENDDEDFF